MPRRNKNRRVRRFDTRLSMDEIARIINLSPREKITILRYIKKREEVDI